MKMKYGHRRGAVFRINFSPWITFSQVELISYIFFEFLQIPNEKVLSVSLETNKKL